jgi:uncharacterized protein YdhG (YjbR/CyaY superfamily)
MDEIPMQEIEYYINNFPPKVQTILKKLRKLVKKTCPESIELFSYGMPAYKLNGKPLVYFAGYKNHIGLYATPDCHTYFKEDLSNYKQGKGSVQFPIEDKIPYDLIKKIIEYNTNSILTKKKGIKKKSL